MRNYSEFILPRGFLLCSFQPIVHQQIQDGKTWGTPCHHAHTLGAFAMLLAQFLQTQKCGTSHLKGLRTEKSSFIRLDAVNKTGSPAKSGFAKTVQRALSKAQGPGRLSSPCSSVRAEDGQAHGGLQGGSHSLGIKGTPKLPPAMDTSLVSLEQLIWYNCSGLGHSGFSGPFRRSWNPCRQARKVHLFDTYPCNSLYK